MELLAEDLVLLLYDDRSGRPQVTAGGLDAALGGAMLADLALAGLVEVRPLGSMGGARVVVTAGGRPDDPLLASALDIVAHKRRAPANLVAALSRRLRPALLARLVDRGVLELREERVLGVFPRNRWLARDVGQEARQRALLHGVLVVGLTPQPRTSALVALLSAIDRAHKVVRDPEVSPREVRRRAKDVARGHWVAKAVRDAVAAAQAAMSAG